jgi:hypothetical protein
MRNLMFVLTMVVLSACESTNQNANHLFKGSWLAWGSYQSTTPASIWSMGPNAMTDTHCAYNWTFEDPLIVGTSKLTVTASNNASGCLAIGTYQCQWSASQNDFTTLENLNAQLAALTVKIACQGQADINLTHY